MTDESAADRQQFVRLLTTTASDLTELPADSATLFYFGQNVARRVGMTRAQLSDYFGGSPFLSAYLATPVGNAAIVTLPLTYLDMVRDRAEAVRCANQGLALARGIGAEHISLAGLLASVTDYGNLLDAPRGYLTTGHATTAASMLTTIETVLASTRRCWQSETVAILGTGSIGQTTAAAALARYGRPAGLILSDLAAKEDAVRQFGNQLQSTYPDLAWSFANSAAPRENPLYEATLVVGCTSTPNALQVERLRPGTLIVDDSVPHCFDVARGLSRAGEARDVVFAYGGMLRFPRPFPVQSYAPPLLHEKLRWPAGLDHVDTVTSCVLSPLLMRIDPTLPPTVGLGIPTPNVEANLGALKRRGIGAPPIQIGGKSPSQDYLAQFVERFATAPTAR